MKEMYIYMYIYGRENKSSKDIIVCREKRRKKKNLENRTRSS